MTTIQDFFFTSRQEAREYARQHGGRVERLGRFAVGSYGLYPQTRISRRGYVIQSDARTMLVWAVLMD